MKQPLWTRDFILITVINFFVFFIFYLLLTMLPLYADHALHASAPQIGLVLTLFFVGAIAVRPFAGKWVTRYSQKTLLLLSSFVYLLAALMYPVATHITALLILRVVHGVSFGVLTTVMGTVAAEILPVNRRGEGFSYFSLAMGIGMVFGPYLALTLANHSAYMETFLLSIGLSVILLPIAFMIRIPIIERNLVPKMSTKFNWKEIIDPRTVKLVIPIFLLALAYSGITTYLPLFAAEMKLVTAASYFFLVYASAMLLFRPFTGKWSDLYGAKVIIVPSMVLFAIGLVVLFSAHASWSLILSGAIIGLGFGSITPIFQAQLIDSVEREKSGMANSLFFNSMDMGMAIGAFALGILASEWGYRNVYVTGFFLVVASLIMYILLNKKRRNNDLQEVDWKNR
ncbi:MFS transporter [Paenisporosarcina cavernae]|uniref:MFS transporter n=1 Tax=Paenisporosarcina cavernae TaxID=2320858 RepID=A0A385YQA9_9BACL|nr:MFS transporter [Paenisporosarcina cavernae]AYC28530.1 MFS transporter [Paenisporosarcina cavernae]